MYYEVPGKHMKYLKYSKEVASILKLMQKIVTIVHGYVNFDAYCTAHLRVIIGNNCKNRDVLHCSGN